MAKPLLTDLQRTPFEVITTGIADKILEVLKPLAAAVRDLHISWTRGAKVSPMEPQQTNPAGAPKGAKPRRYATFLFAAEHLLVAAVRLCDTVN